ncbi:MAG: hypothetical protein L3J28_04615 [Candidatus Polarisedimenticolaceae bacterium]|nr:hypothetical protein [Candidatus Polarisedimenticolaceae bacterium]
MKCVWAFATTIGLQACMVSGPTISQPLIKHTQATEAYKPDRDMADIKLAAHLSKTDIVAGELLAIRNTLNNSTSPIEIETFRPPYLISIP